MTEKIKLNGSVKAVSNPFSNNPTESNMIIIETEKGMVSVPVTDPHQYHLFQKVNVLIEIKKIDD